MCTTVWYPPGANEWVDWLLPPQREWFDEFAAELPKFTTRDVQGAGVFRQAVDGWQMVVEWVVFSDTIVVETMTATRGDFHLKCGLARNSTAY
jgi:hypothetical protein